MISKRIAEAAKDTGRDIALDDLRGIRDRTTARGGEARNRLSGWAFTQLGSFIVYKARRAGVSVISIDPRYTSQTCSERGHREESDRRSRSEFSRPACGHRAHADRNAALNIGAQATRKMASGLGNRPGHRVA